MPLVKGAGRKAVAENIRELMHSFAKKGSIGTSHPTSKRKAQKQAVAIALSQQRRSLAEGG